MKWFVYILLCDRQRYYTGITDNMERRLLQHDRKESPYTKQFSEIEQVHTESYTTRAEAERRELQLKGWSVAKKKALIENDIDLLKKLSNGS